MRCSKLVLMMAMVAVVMSGCATTGGVTARDAAAPIGAAAGAGLAKALGLSDGWMIAGAGVGAFTGDQIAKQHDQAKQQRQQGTATAIAAAQPAGVSSTVEALGNPARNAKVTRDASGVPLSIVFQDAPVGSMATVVEAVGEPARNAQVTRDSTGKVMSIVYL